MDCKLDYDAFGLVAGGSISLMSRPGRTFARAAASWVTRRRANWVGGVVGYDRLVGRYEVEGWGRLVVAWPLIYLFTFAVN